MIEEDFINGAFEQPDKINRGYKDRFIIQKKWDEEHVLRVVYEE